MKKIIYLLFILLCSCNKLILDYGFKKMGAYENTCKISYLSNKDKQLAFINMHHIGKKEFYNDVASKIDSLQKEDYIIFCESVGFTNKIDSLKEDIYERKFRKAIGFGIDSYIDTTKNTFIGEYKLSKKQQILINQPDYHVINVDTSLVVKADVGMDILIDEFEKKYNEIKLDNCDLNTDLKSTYYCNKFEKNLKEKFHNEFILEYRNRHVATKINNHKSDKIAIIYGKYHLKGIYEELKKTDSNWVLTNYN